MSELVYSKNLTLHDLETKFHLEADKHPQFFSEWQNNLPEVSDQEKQFLDKLKEGYLNLVKYPPVLENTVQIAILGPLLFLADFYLPPFHITSEISVRVSDTDEDITVEGKIDILVLREHLWVMVIESKRASFSVEAGLAQLLSYMLANPHNGQHPNIGLITTGGSFMFLKLIAEEHPRYSLSRIFEIRNPGNDLYIVLSILKQFCRLFSQAE